ncbi:MAG TPA: non-ribosomal peptide synthetase [Casimicrobiaceae bacterium]
MISFDRASYAEHLAALADASPTAPAWLTPGREPMSRSALVARIDDARRRFDAWGIGRGDVVAWPVIDREGASSLLAVVPAIATLSPLPAGMTPDAYARTYDRLRVKAVVLPRAVRHAAAEAASRAGVTIIEATPAAANLAGSVDLALVQPTSTLERAAHVRDDVMYVSLTSGTTGRPKLVPHAWGAVALTAQALGVALDMREDDVSAHITSLHLANGLRTAAMLALLNGGAVDVLPEADLDAFLAAVAIGDVTYTSSSFAMHRELLRRLDGARVASRGRLRFVRVASGRLARDEMDRLEATFGVPVVTGLSCTETGTIAQQRLSSPRVRGSVGSPVACELRVADEHGHALPAGVVGEVQVRGPHVFAGYLDDPALTATAFVDGWFRLGDLGRLDERGELHLEGRLTDTINRGGEKISPLEIDAVLERVPGVAEAAAFGIEHPALGEEVVAAVVRERGSALDAAQVVAAARAALGDRRSPRHVWFVDALPRTESGKLKRADLPGLVPVNGHARADEAAPTRTSTPLEIAVGALWAATLRRDRVGIDDNFFMLGGDSLRGAKLLTQVNSAFGVDLAVPALFDDANTIAGMARAIERARR